VKWNAAETFFDLDGQSRKVERRVEDVKALRQDQTDVFSERLESSGRA
jgi:hypothetical protein